MKNSLIFVVLLLSMNNIILGQNFEGEVIYNNLFKSKINNLTDSQLGVMIGSKQEYLIKGGNYKSFMNGQTISMQLYDYKTNRLYNRTPKSDTLYWFDASINTDKVINYEIKKNAAYVLGNLCDAIVMKTKTGTTTIYYSEKYKVDSSSYTNHHYSNWSFFVLKTGSLPLKTIIETNHFSMESTAIEIKKLKLDDDYFEIDPNTPTRKS
ncbi:MAG TPA: hypothetical protein VD794_12505 [Flavisolibacter sp.]|nr:hypothetical protein [Flavisolibacter sp.]